MKLDKFGGREKADPDRPGRVTYHGTSHWDDLEAMSPDLADAISSVSKAIRKSSAL